MKQSKLHELENLILFGEHSDEEWKEIDKMVDEELEKASEAEKEAFMDSGAGEALTQILEYMD